MIVLLYISLVCLLILFLVMYFSRNIEHYRPPSFKEKKCIFCCVFNQQKYLHLFYRLLESILTYGNLDENTDILVYTSTSFMNQIKQSHLFNEKIKFEINNTYSDIEKACKSKLDLFKLKDVSKYKKILYLDTDILVKDDLNKVFKVCKKDILYTLEQGKIDDKQDFWGYTLFSEENVLDKYKGQSAFTTGILLFNNCKSISDLFERILQYIKKVNISFQTFDQPYIVYYSFISELYDNQILKSLVVNNDENIHNNKVICHFPGNPGYPNRKLVVISEFLKRLKDYTIMINIDKTKLYIDQYLIPIITNFTNSGEQHEGNIFMESHIKHTDNLEFRMKQKNISNVVLNRQIKKVMEIGFNSGFSSLLMLISNPNIKIDCFDIGEHKYTLPCYEHIKKSFPDRINLMIGDSTKTLPKLKGHYDLIHIDGGHSVEVAKSDIDNSLRLADKRSILIMDDYNYEWLHKLWDKYIHDKKMKNLDIYVYETSFHDIKYLV